MNLEEILPMTSYLIRRYRNGDFSLPIDNGGFVMTKDEWESFKAAYDRFYETDEYLEINKKRELELEKGRYIEKRQPEKPKQTKGNVYFVFAKKNGEDIGAKIGFTTNIKSRMKTLKTASPFELELFVYIPFVPKIEEEKAHEFFKQHRLEGEWFDIKRSDAIVYARNWEIFKFGEEDNKKDG